MKVYLDHAATTPVDPEVLKAMEPYFCNKFGNASSQHFFGQEATKAVDEARDKVAKFLNCQPDEIIFTSGATEADNLAIEGIVSSAKNKFHIITTSIEHPAVLETCKHLERAGAEVSFIKPGTDGIVKVKDIEKEIKDNTILISVMYVNNEIGTIQPIKDIGKMLKKINKKRKDKIHFHTDAVQAVNYCPMDVNELGVDLLCLLYTSPSPRDLSTSRMPSSA